jgi:BMFP domain-containing protein YqiC
MTRRPAVRRTNGLELDVADRHCLISTLAVRSRPEIPTMTQTSNRFFDEIGRLMNDAAGAAQGVKREVDTVVRNQAEKILRDLDVVKREEFEAVKDMARLAREENEALKTRIAALEARLGVSPSAPDAGSLKTDG